MGSVLLIDLAYALGVAFNPTIIVVVIVMLFSARARTNGLAFLGGRLIGLFILIGVVFWLTGQEISFLRSHSFIDKPYIELILGMLLLLLAGVEWRRHRKLEGPQPPSRPTAIVDNLLERSSGAVTPARALTLAVVMSAFSIKNLIFMQAAAINTFDAHLDTQQNLLLLVVFILVSSISVGIPVLYAAAKGEKAEVTLNRWKDWLIANTTLVAIIFLILIGVLLMGKSVSELLKLPPIA